MNTITVLAWYHECERLKGHFSADSRGKLKKGWLCNEEDLLDRFITFPTATDRITVQMTHKFVDGKLLSSDVCGVSRLNLLYTYGLQVPVPENTVYWWMKHEGCVFYRATQTFHTGGHGGPEVVRYRNYVYIERL